MTTSNCLLFCSTSWSYIEDGEELSEQKDDLLLNNRPASGMTSSDASVAAAALAACTDAQRGMDNMSRSILLTHLHTVFVILVERISYHIKTICLWCSMSLFSRPSVCTLF